MIDAIFYQAANRPHQPAMIMPDRVITFAMLESGIKCAGTHIAALDLKPGDIAAIVIENPIRHMIIACALLHAGIAAVSLRKSSERIKSELGVTIFLEERNEYIIPGARQKLVTADWFSQPAPARPSARSFSKDAACRIAFSSGTTGEPKAIVHTFGNLEKTREIFNVSVGGGNWGRLLCLPPLTSNWGFKSALFTLLAGKTLCFAFSAQESLDMIEVYLVDCLLGSVHHLRELLTANAQKRAHLNSLRLVYTGGSGMSPQLINAFQAGLCRNLYSHYSSTETGASAVAHAGVLASIPGAVGVILPGAQIEIVGENETPLPCGTQGRVRIRTSQMGRYLHAKAGQDNLRGGWFYPGDTGALTPEGILCIHGRSTEIINSGGVKISPDVVENILRGHAGVKDVAALGIVNELGVEELWVAIVPFHELEGEAILDRAASEGVSIDRIIPVADIPRTPLGKIARESLKQSLT